MVLTLTLAAIHVIILRPAVFVTGRPFINRNYYIHTIIGSRKEVMKAAFLSIDLSKKQLYQICLTINYANNYVIYVITVYYTNIITPHVIMYTNIICYANKIMLHYNVIMLHYIILSTNTRKCVYA